MASSPRLSSPARRWSRAPPAWRSAMPGVRPCVAETLCAALNAGVTPELHTIGSVGQADLSQMAEIGLAITGQTISARGAAGGRGRAAPAPTPREAHAILNSNAYTVGTACLALERARRALAALERAAALSCEAVLANPDALHPAIFAARPYPGDEVARAHLSQLLAGGALAERRRAPRNLQDSLCFKGMPQTHGAAHGALAASARTAVDRAALVGRQRVRGAEPRTGRSRPAATRSRPWRSRSITRVSRSPAR